MRQGLMHVATQFHGISRRKFANLGNKCRMATLLMCQISLRCIQKCAR